MSKNENISFKIEDLKPVILNLINAEKRSLVFEILDFYYAKAKTLYEFDTLGYLALKAEHRELYLNCAKATYSMAENSEQLYVCRENLYRAYNLMNDPNNALFYININLQINPEDFGAMSQKIFSLALLGNRKESDELLLYLFNKYPDRREDLQSAFSGILLREGKISEGILAFLNKFKINDSDFKTISKMKRWDGIIQPGRILYLEGEGGIGDEIINIRFLKNIQNLGMRPILYSTWSDYRKDTVDVFRRHGYEVITESYSINRKELWAPLMSLPGLLNLNESNLWTETYLTPLKKEKNKLSSNKFKIGIKCSGNPYFSQDEYRKIPINKILEYLPKNAEIYYIDKTPTNKDGVIDLSPRIESWEDTLDFIDQMDCIVSSCTSLVHAAGAMGKTTFVIVPIAEYYIWTSSSKTTKSPWYGDNFYVYKQKTHANWDEPLYNMREKLNIILGE
jgi:hypothetical protein